MNNKPDEEKEDEVGIVENKYAENLASPFLKQLKSWENENDFSIPEDIIENIKMNQDF